MLKRTLHLMVIVVLLLTTVVASAQDVTPTVEPSFGSELMQPDAGQGGGEVPAENPRGFEFPTIAVSEVAFIVVVIALVALAFINAQLVPARTALDLFDKAREKAEPAVKGIIPGELDDALIDAIVKEVRARLLAMSDKPTPPNG